MQNNPMQRRALLRGSLSLGAATLLTGCDISDGDAVQSALHAISRWNDRVQAFLFREQAMAKEYAAGDVAKAFRYNAYYPAQDVAPIDPGTYRLDRRQAPMDGAAADGAATQDAAYAPCVRGGLELCRAMERRALG